MAFVFNALRAIFFLSFLSRKKSMIQPITAQSVSWQRVSYEFFQRRCAICHGQGGANINTSDYNSAISQSKRIEEAVLTRKSMPLTLH